MATMGGDDRARVATLSVAPAEMRSAVPITGSSVHAPGKGVVAVMSHREAVSMAPPTTARGNACRREVTVNLLPPRASNAPAANSHARVAGP